MEWLALDLGFLWCLESVPLKVLILSQKICCLSIDARLGMVADQRAG